MNAISEGTKSDQTMVTQLMDQLHASIENAESQLEKEYQDRLQVTSSKDSRSAKIRI